MLGKLTITSAFFLSFLFTASLSAQDDFEGSVTYSIDYLDVPAEMKGMEAMLPDSTTKYFSGTKIRLEQKVAGSGTQVIISDRATNFSVVLMDILGSKIAMEVPEDELEMEDEKAKKQEIKYTKETKTIAGYKCKKAIITSEDSLAPMVVWYTTKLPYVEGQFGDLKGMPLEMTIYQNELQMKLVAAVVYVGEIDDDLFVVPEGYSVMSSGELMEFFGGQQ